MNLNGSSNQLAAYAIHWLFLFSSTFIYAAEENEELSAFNNFIVVEESCQVDHDGEVVGEIAAGTRLYALMGILDLNKFYVKIPGSEKDYGWIQSDSIRQEQIQFKDKDDRLRWFYYSEEVHKTYQGLWQSRRYDEAQEKFEEYVAIKREYHGSGHPIYADLLIEHAQALLNVRRYAEAERLLAIAEPILREAIGNKYRGLAPLLLVKSRLAAVRGDLVNAIELAKRSIEILKHSIEDLSKLSNSSEPASSTEKFFRNHIRNAKRAQQIIRVWLADCLLASQQFEEASQQLKKTRDYHRKILGPTHPRVLIASLSLAEAVARSGEVARSIEQIENTVTLAERSGGDSDGIVAQGFSALAKVYPLADRLDLAVVYAGEALRAIESENQSASEDPTHYTRRFKAIAALADAQLQVGQLDAAKRTLLKALPLVDIPIERNEDEKSQTLVRLAWVSTRLGDGASAVKFCRNAVELQAALYGEQAVPVSFRSTLARSLVSVGSVREAIEQLKLATKDTQDRSLSDLYELGRLYHASGEMDPALHAWDEFERLLSRGAEDPEPEWLRSKQRGMIALARGDFDNATKPLARSLGGLIAQYGPHSLDQAEVHLQLGRAANGLGQAEEALHQLSLARRAHYSFATRVLPVLNDREQSAFVEKVDRTNLLTSLKIAVAIDSSESRRRIAEWLLHSKALARQSNSLSMTSNDGKVAKASRQLARVREHLAAAAYGTRGLQDVATLRAEESRLLMELRSGSLKESKATRFSWTSFEMFRRSLPSNVLYVDLFTAASKKSNDLHYMAALTQRDSDAPELIDFGPISKIDRLMKAAREEIIRAGPDLAATSARSLLQLSQLITTAMTHRLDGIGQLVICPDGNTWLLPWAALSLSSGEYLLESVSLTLVNAGKRIASSQDSHLPTAPAVFADPDFDMKLGGANKPPNVNRGLSPSLQASRFLTGAKLDRLPGTRSEALAIRESLRTFASAEPAMFLGRDATESAIKSLRGPKALVIGTHGYYLKPTGVNQFTQEVAVVDGLQVAAFIPRADDAMLRSGLLFAGFNGRRGVLHGADDGVLTALEATSLDLQGTEVVVLSSCKSGVGDIRAGEGVASVCQAFQIAGAESVVATLWDIPDEASTCLVTALMRELSQGASVHRALRAAQLSMLRGGIRECEDAAKPWFWSGFVVVTQDPFRAQK